MPEIETAIFSRVRALTGIKGGDDPDYLAGLAATITDVLEYGLAGIEHGEDWTGPIPSTAAAQARRAARNGVSLDMVLRRYTAGDRLLGEFIMDEAANFPSQALKRILGTHGPHLDRLMAAVSTEYMEEIKRMRRSPEQRLAEQVERLLSGEDQLDVGNLDYDLDCWHLGLIAKGMAVNDTVRRLAAHLDCRTLIVPHHEQNVWVWLGSAIKPADADLSRFFAVDGSGVSFAIGEWRRGPAGWRLTHHEARAAFNVMLRTREPVVRSRDAILVVAASRDEMLAESLRETYLAPLDDFGDFGKILQETLRAYLASGLNAATAAAALNVDRHTVQRRLRKVESALGCLLQDRYPELAVALRLEDLGQPVFESGNAPSPLQASFR